MSVPANILQKVATYQDASMAYLSNFGCFISNANKKFDNFQDLVANLGTSVTFKLPTRGITTNSLNVTFQETQMRQHTLTVDQQISYAFAFSDQEFLYTVEDYMNDFGLMATAEIGSAIEANVARNAITGPYRFYGDGRMPITSVDQIAEAFSTFETFGTPKTGHKAFLQDISMTKMVSNALNQFVPMRNDDMADSWKVGNYAGFDVYKSNLLALHTAGNVGNNNDTLTVVSVVKNSEGGITSITFSGADVSDADAIKQYDKAEFQDISGYPIVRFRTFVGHQPSAAHVQFMATADAESDGSGNVTVFVNPPLQAASGRNQNITTDIVAGMQVKFLPNHRAGLISAGNALFLAMPRMNTKSPYASASATDPDTGVSLRTYYGSGLGNNFQGYIYDQIWGSTFVPEYGMTVVYPE